jgi:hypothetical protein
MPTYQETIAGYTAADWDAVITLHRNDIQRLQARYGTQASIAWVGEEIGYLQLKIKQAEQRKAALAAGDDNANI